MNKNIFTYWHQGFENAPWVVSKCVHQLKALHPNWDLHLLDKNNVHFYTDPLPFDRGVQNKMKIAHWSDLIRTQLLFKYGGVWLDPTAFCNYSLDEWLFSHMDAGLFLFLNPGRDRVISNWFIASEKDNKFLKKLYYELCEYWQNNNFRNFNWNTQTTLEFLLKKIINRNPDWPRIWFSPFMTKILRIYPYLVYHYKFYDLIQKDAQCKQIWNSMNGLDAAYPHQLQEMGLLNYLSEEARELIDDPQSPVFKLSWNLSLDSPPKDTVIDYLLSGARNNQ